MRDEIAANPFMKRCIRKHEGTCSGRITWEHALQYANRQINEPWAIVPLCEYHHFDDLDKGYGQYIALARASQKDLEKYPKTNWQQQYEYLKSKYGKHSTEGEET